jgi:hypothetical protein
MVVLESKLFLERDEAHDRSLAAAPGTASENFETPMAYRKQQKT